MTHSEKCKLYYQRNRESSAKRNAEYRKNNKEILAEYNKKYYLKNKVSIRSNGRSYYLKNKESYCKNGKNYRAKRKLKDPNYEVARGLKRNYGISLEQYEAMLRNQNGLCAICDCVLEHRGHGLNNANVDHCHSTKIVRGILCGQCNRGIGLLKDSAELLRKAVAYLDGHLIKIWQPLQQ